MNISAQDRERISAAIRAAEARPRARSSACWRRSSYRRHGAADPPRGSGRARAAVAAGRLHGDAGPPDPVVAGRRLFHPRRCALPAARARRAAAARGAPRRRPSRRHGAVHDPRHRAQEGPHRHTDLRLAGEAMRASSPTRALPPACRSRNGRARSIRSSHICASGRIADGFVTAIEVCGKRS